MKRKAFLNTSLVVFGVVYLCSYPVFSVEPPKSERPNKLWLWSIAQQL
jgi:hypothetical protein